MHVFVDESERGGTYLVCAASYMGTDLDKARAAVRSLQKPGQRRVHMVKERDSRRRQIIDTVATTGTQASIYLCVGPAVAARVACLHQLLGDLAMEASRKPRLTLEWMDGQDHRDRETIARARAAMPALAAVEYEHRRAHEEPLLAVADAVAWAYGAGGQWRRRVERMVRRVTELRL